MTRATPFHPRGPCPTSSPCPVPKALAFKPPVASVYRLDFPNFPSSTRSSQEGRVPETGLEGAPGALTVKSRYFGWVLAEPGLLSSSLPHAQHVRKLMCWPPCCRRTNRGWAGLPDAFKPPLRTGHLGARWRTCESPW